MYVATVAITVKHTVKLNVKQLGSSSSSSSSSISWVSIHFDASGSSISWISVHCNVTTIWILFSVNILIIIHFNLFLELIPTFVIQAGNDDTDQCSNNKCDKKCDHYTDSNYFSCGELIIII